MAPGEHYETPCLFDGELYKCNNINCFISDPGMSLNCAPTRVCRGMVYVYYSMSWCMLFGIACGKVYIVWYSMI